MKPLPLRERVLGALMLTAMPLRSISRALCADYEAVRRVVDAEREFGRIVVAGMVKPKTGRPAAVYGLAA